MSFSFSINSKKSISYQDLLEALPLPQLSIEEELDRKLTISGVFHLYISGASCRSVEVGNESSGYRVRINSPASAEDHRLALCVVESLALLAESDSIQSEAKSEFQVKELRLIHNDKWINSELDSGLRSTLLMAVHASKNGSVCSIKGAKREFHLGAEMALRLLRLNHPEKISREFFQIFRLIQYIETQGYVAPKIYVHRSTKRKMCALGPGLSYFIPWVQHIALIPGPGEESIYLAHQDLLNILGSRLKLLDEKQGVIEAIPEKEWKALLLEAEKNKLNLAQLQGISN
ncbi:MAG: DUF4299 domain-containing protein [Candidatus Obscuribacterales bacterium]|nr:DUF4299 domain-containing protein [Candidatus Obscuribacterales bacterium]